MKVNCVEIRYVDYNGAAKFVENQFSQAWSEIESVVRGLPLHLKASDQAGKQGSPIFDVVGTNLAIREQLVQFDWGANVQIPTPFRFLGSDIDFFKQGLLLEVQFSNYPFLLNNLIRSELFYKSKVRFKDISTEILVIISKGRMFESSNSTLYFEQAIRQIEALTTYHVVTLPIRLVGLFSPLDVVVPTLWSEYHTLRYSRTIMSRRWGQCKFVSSGDGTRPKLQVIDS